MSDTTLIWGEIDGRTITFPMEVTAMDAATMVFSVPADAAQRLLPGDDFDVIDIGGGVAQFVLALVDYLDNPWGDYLEINLGFLARPRGAAAEVAGSFVYRMPVDQAFTCKAGNEVMGFPKTVEDLARTDADGRVTFTMHQEGEQILAVTFPAAPAAGEATRVDTVSYSYLHGEARETPLALELGTGMIDPADVAVELGSGPIADELRSLGLPKAPDFATWGTGLSGTFQAARPVTR